MVNSGTKNTGSGVKKLDLFIGGELVSPFCDQYFDNLNPDTGAVWQQVAEASIDDVNRAVLNSYETWNQSYRDSTVSERELWLKRAAEIIERDKDNIVDELCTEAGLPITQADREVESSIKVLYSIAAMATSMNQQKQISDFSGRVVMNIREPVGVCASICSANEPFFTPVRLSAIALMLGNTVVSLSSSFTPNASLRLAMVYQEAGFPDGAYNQLSGFGAKIGDFLTMHPMAKAVLFQGAGSIGKRISEVCGLQMKGCVLGFGNKSSVFINRDADLERAGNMVPLYNNRIICDETVYQRFLELLKKRVRSICDHGMGSLKNQHTSIGPVLSPDIKASINAHIADAEKKGAIFVTRGSWVGNRFQPTILADVTPEMTLCRSDVLGPVVSVYKAKGFEEGLLLANDIDFSASSSIWTANINKAMEFSRRSLSHATYINTDASVEGSSPAVELTEVGQPHDMLMEVEQMTHLKSVALQLPAKPQIRGSMRMCV